MEVLSESSLYTMKPVPAVPKENVGDAFAEGIADEEVEIAVEVIVQPIGGAAPP
jgi:hypothetical protein